MVMQAPDGWLAQIIDRKSREQEERYHAMLGDIARQCVHLNRHLDTETWKRLCVDAFRRETLDDGRIANYWLRNGVRYMPSLDGSAVIALGEQTRHFPAYVASAFIEWLFAFGAEREVRWTDPTQPPAEAYPEARA